jgi:hypothetical protein
VKKVVLATNGLLFIALITLCYILIFSVGDPDIFVESRSRHFDRIRIRLSSKCWIPISSVADPNPGSGAFLPPGSGRKIIWIQDPAFLWNFLFLSSYLILFYLSYFILNVFIYLIIFRIFVFFTKLGYSYNFLLKLKAARKKISFLLLSPFLLRT